MFPSSSQSVFFVGDGQSQKHRLITLSLPPICDVVMFTTEKIALMYLYMTFVLSKRDTRPRALLNRHNPSLFCSGIAVYSEYEHEFSSKNAKGCMHSGEQVTLVNGGNTLV